MPISTFLTLTNATDQLVDYGDVSFAICLGTHHSLDAEIFCLASATIFYSSKLIIVICRSYTEAEFLFCV
jgi:hypothetical protein